MKKDNTLKRWLKLGFTLGYTPRDDRHHKAGYEQGIIEGLRLAQVKENLRKRQSRKNSIARRKENA